MVPDILNVKEEKSRKYGKIYVIRVYNNKK